MIRESSPASGSRHGASALRVIAAVALVAVGTLTSATATDPLRQMESRLTEFRLDNGLHFLVVERHELPVIAFHTYVDAGSVDEPRGVTGVAHLCEHLAFKGTHRIGVVDAERERELTAELDRVFLALKEERRRTEVPGHWDRLRALEDRFETLQRETREYLVPGEFARIVKRAGGEGLAANASVDAIRYRVSLPSNRLELWALLESQRLLHPVTRDFYGEKHAVREERKMRTELNPTGQLLEEFQALAFKAHPYGSPPIGHASDLFALTRTDAETFYRRHFHASNMTIAVVGDVDPAEVKRIAEKYLSALPPRDPDDDATIDTIEPPQPGDKRITIVGSAPPILLVGFHGPSRRDPDFLPVEVLLNVLASGRASRLDRRLVETDRVAAEVGSWVGVPGTKYPSLAVIWAIATPGQGNDAVEAAIYDEIERMIDDGISEAELHRVVARLRADVGRQLVANEDTAAALAEAQVLRGDWRRLFLDPERIVELDRAALKKLARTIFRRSNRVVGRLDLESSPSEPKGKE